MPVPIPNTTNETISADKLEDKYNIKYPINKNTIPIEFV